jgi:hypothetical protein
MRICVCGQAGGDGAQPRAFYLGGRQLKVVAVRGRWLEAGRRCYEVAVDDGRHFILRHEPSNGQWELAGVYRAGRTAARARTPD